MFADLGEGNQNAKIVAAIAVLMSICWIGNGRLEVIDMIKSGSLVNLIGAIIITFFVFIVM